MDNKSNHMEKQTYYCFYLYITGYVNITEGYIQAEGTSNILSRNIKTKYIDILHKCKQTKYIDILHERKQTKYTRI